MCTSGLCDTCLHIPSDKFYNFNCVSLLAPLHTTAKFSSTSYREPNRWLQLHLLLASSTSSSGSLGGGLLQFPQKANSLSGGHTLTAMDSGWSVHMESHEIWVSKFTGKSVMGFNSIRILNPIRIFIFIFFIYFVKHHGKLRHCYLNRTWKQLKQTWLAVFSRWKKKKLKSI